MEQEYKQLFVGGDLSGIQKFLYNITSRHASISLKGRSAFLSNYLRDICDKIEDKILECNGTFEELYCSGGKFYLITENTPVITSALNDFIILCMRELWKDHRGQLGLNISFIAYKEENGKFYVKGHEDEQNTNSGVLWKYVNTDFARQKNQKFKELLLDNYDHFFETIPVGGKPLVCALTGIESDECIPLDDDVDDEEDAGAVFLPSVVEQIREGKRLNIQQGLLNNNRKVKSFSDYAEGSYLGILRMDVDGLGKRFIIGFDTIKEYKEFSAKVKDFFEGRIGDSPEYEKKDKLLDELDSETGLPYRNFMNVIYAGGDDLFIIGRWDKLINFAELIHKKTEEYFHDNTYWEDTIDANGNQVKVEHRITISGGIAIVKPKYPIDKAAEMAREAEEAAKQGKKNAFNVFGKTISWEKDFEEVKIRKNKFVDYLQDSKLSKSILHKLMLYASIAEENKNRKKKEEPEDYSYIWHISYYLTRYIKRYEKDNKEACEYFRKLRDKGLNYKDIHNLEMMAIAARWAELILKMKDNNNN